MRQTVIKALVIGPILLLLSVAGGYAVCPVINVSPSVAYAAFTPQGAASSSLYRINLSTGAATLIGPIGSSATVHGIAIDVSGDIVAIDGAGTTVFSFPHRTPATITSSAAITGLQASESILAIDFRPANGLLYGLGSTSRLYTINPSTGVATLVGGQFATLLSGTEFGFDVNPTADRIRVVSNTGQNFRLNPDTGGLAATDTNLNGGATTAVGSAYDNNFVGATVTTLYAINATTDSLYIQNPPNGGTLVLVGSLGVNATEALGFDISSLLLDALTGNAYSETFAATGGTPPYTFSTGSTLPSGISLSSSGAISGTTTQTGTFAIKVDVVDFNGCTGTHTYNLKVSCPTITVSPSILPGGVTGVSYSQTIVGSGGTGPYLFALDSGTLPPGLVLNTSTGHLSSTPTAEGSYSFTIRVTDSSGCIALASYTVDVTCPALSTLSSTAYASLTGPGAIASSLYSINLSTGAATVIGAIGTAGTVRGITIDPGGDIFAIDGVGTTLLSFSRKTPGTITSSGAITGLQAGESILAIDFRPANGALYGLGSTSRLYSINTSTAEATMVGTDPFTPALSGTDFGFDFNPTADRIRVVSNTGQNLRIVPDTGLALTDSILNGAATGAVGSAYTNSFAGATVTTLYAIDATTDSLYIQNPANSGTLVLVGALGFNTGTLVGFDISNPRIFPDAVADGLFSETLTGAGGTGPYTFLITAGALPSGLSLSAAGVLSGTATATGIFTFTITMTDANHCALAQQYTLHVLRPPSNLVATATSTTFVSLTWTSPVVDHFEVWRNSGSGFVYRASSIGASYSESVAPTAAYAYKVRAVDVDGHVSAFSASDVATTITFTDDPLVVLSTTIKAIHVSQLRQAINLIRGLTPLGAFSFTDNPVNGHSIQLVHLTELRTALDQTRAILGLPSQTYTPRSIGSPVGSAEITELRAAVK